MARKPTPARLTAARALARAAETFRLLSAPSRLRIFTLVVEGGEVGSGDLRRAAGLSAVAISRHLVMMRAAGLIESRRRGHYALYSLGPRGAAAVELLAALKAVGGARE